jgi:hypothetical protein
MENSLYQENFAVSGLCIQNQDRLGLPVMNPNGNEKKLNLKNRKISRFRERTVKT